MDRFFNPNSIAVIGASSEEKTVGNVVLKELLKSGKKVFPVNPNRVMILDKFCYKSILSIEENIDLAIFCVPAQIIPPLLEETGKKGVKNVIIISAGFSEIGAVLLEERILAISKEYGMRLLGPNCLGVLNPPNFNASFFEGNVKKGKIAFISQSGALGVAMLDKFKKEEYGLSAFVSVGNMTDIDFSDLISYFERDSNTKVICIYMEALKDGRKFMDSVLFAKKPIIVLKAGKGKIGQMAAGTHTGALASDSRVYSGAFVQCGAIEVETLEEMFSLAKAIECCDNLNQLNNGIIITNAGGPAVLLSDYLEKNNVNLIELSKTAVGRLSEFLPKAWSHNNPVDIIGDAKAERYSQVFEMLKFEKFDFSVCVLTPQAMTEPRETAKLFCDFVKKTKKPGFALFMGGERIDDAKAIFDEFNVPCFESPEILAKTLYNIQKIE